MKTKEGVQCYENQLKIFNSKWVFGEPDKSSFKGCKGRNYTAVIGGCMDVKEMETLL